MFSYHFAILRTKILPLIELYEMLFNLACFDLVVTYKIEEEQIERERESDLL